MNKKFKGGGISAPATVVPAEVLAYQKIIAALIAVPT
jgi:hypothetical protein